MSDCRANQALNRFLHHICSKSFDSALSYKVFPKDALNSPEKFEFGRQIASDFQHGRTGVVEAPCRTPGLLRDPNRNASPVPRVRSYRPPRGARRSRARNRKLRSEPVPRREARQCHGSWLTWEWKEESPDQDSIGDSQNSTPLPFGSPAPAKPPTSKILLSGIDSDSRRLKLRPQLVQIAHPEIGHRPRATIAKILYRLPRMPEKRPAWPPTAELSPSGAIPRCSSCQGANTTKFRDFRETSTHAHGVYSRQSSLRINSSSFVLCFTSRPVRGPLWITRAGLGWPTRSRALAFTVFEAENVPGLRFVMARTSME